MSKIKFNAAIAAAAALASLAPSALPTAASAQVRGVTNCDAPGGRQQAGALIGGVIGALAGSQISKNERGLGAVAGGAAGAAAGSYIGCNQQQARAASSNYSYDNSAQYRSSANLNVRSGPGTNYRVVSRLSPGQPFSVIGSQGEWVQIAGGGWVNAHYVTR
jgi:uncharacterized protein YcfJ